MPPAFPGKASSRTPVRRARGPPVISMSTMPSWIASVDPAGTAASAAAGPAASGEGPAPSGAPPNHEATSNGRPSASTIRMLGRSTFTVTGPRVAPRKVMIGARMVARPALPLASEPRLPRRSTWIESRWIPAGTNSISR